MLIIMGYTPDAIDIGILLFAGLMLFLFWAVK